MLALPGLPLVVPGDDLVTLLLAAVERAGEALQGGDVLVLAQKIVSKAEDRYVDLSAVEPSQRAIELAQEVDKDPRLVEVILSESTEVVRYRPGVLVVAHRLGLVLANAGVDHSNVEQPVEQPATPGAEPDCGYDERVLLLPRDPDGSAARLRRELCERCGCEIGVLIVDSLGRAWRRGTVGVAIGAAGVVSLSDQRGESDLFGRTLRVTEVGHADQLAAAASVVMGQAAEGTPAVLIRGARMPGPRGPASDLLRPKEEDLFR